MKKWQKNQEKQQAVSIAANIYDEDLGYYVCDVNLDEDEMSRFLSDTFYNCPYFQMEDEYKIVRKQMQKTLRLAGKETIMKQQVTYGLSKG